jgi:hypothetical protein
LIQKPIKLGTRVFVAADPLKPIRECVITDRGPASGDDVSRWLYLDTGTPALNADCFEERCDAVAHMKEKANALQDECQRAGARIVTKIETLDEMERRGWK